MLRSFRKHILPLLLLMTAVLFFLPARGLPEEPVILEGYFTGPKLVRPGPVRAGESLQIIPAYEPVRLTVVDKHWGTLILENGKTGYLFYDGILPLPEYDTIPEKEMYSGTAVPVTGLPLDEAPSVGTLEARTLCTVDGISGSRSHIRLSDSSLSGYVPTEVLLDPVFTLPAELLPVTVTAAEPATVTSLPLRGAETTGRTPAETFFTAYEAGFTDHLVLKDGETVSYIRKDEVCICEIDPESGIPLFVTFNEEYGAEPRLVYAYTGAEGAVLRVPGSDGTVLPPDTRVFVYMEYGGMLSVSAGDLAGYVNAGSLKPETAAMKAALLKETDLSGATVSRNEYLDQAFTMLEETNSFLLRYNAVTGAEIEPLFPTGVPYFWGGRSYNVLRGQYPEYSTLLAWQSSPLYYRKGTAYLYGFDCVGFVKAVYSLAKHPITEEFRNLFTRDYCRAGHHVACRADLPFPEDWKEAAALMEPGDILTVFHPGEHVMMYIGTLRQYGYTEDQLSLPADYLDYPLVIQCGEDPFCYMRFTDYILSSENERILKATPPDGGVGICILGVPPQDAEYIIRAPHTDYPCFLVEGTCVNVFDFSRVTDYIVYRR